uniref:Uncharacterized protein n=1 Tax=Ditylenchus dipsaci TaxID=166011 RepID=A0A915DJ35_9BILA
MKIASYKRPTTNYLSNLCSHNNDSDYQPHSQKKIQPKKVVFVLGPPGSGKGTLCGALSQHFGFVHFSIGDLLRAECQKPESKLRDEIVAHMQNGTIVDSRISVKLLKKAIFSKVQSNKFVIDAFPFNQQNLDAWTNQELDKELYVPFVVYLDVPLDVCADRCISRNQGRVDDSKECIEKRMLTYISQSQRIIEHYKKLNMIHIIDASKTANEVFNAAEKLFKEQGLPENK